MNRTEWQACAFALATVSEQVTQVLRAVPAGDPEKLSPEWQAIGRLCDASRGLEGVARVLVELANAPRESMAQRQIGLGAWAPPPRVWRATLEVLNRATDEAGAAAEARPELHARILREARAIYEKWMTTPNHPGGEDLTSPAAAALLSIGKLLGGA